MSVYSSFVSKLWPAAKVASAGTGLSPCLFIVQWAQETGNGTCSNCPPAAGCNNYAGINGSGCGYGYAKYANLTDFANACVAVLHQNGYGYPAVLATAGQALHTQMTALGSSGWAASHYGSPPGSDLWSLWESAYSKLGLSCGVSAAPPPSPPKPPSPPTPVTILGNVVVHPGHPHLLPAFLILGGGAVLAGWQLHEHPQYRKELFAPVEEDYRRARHGISGVATSVATSVGDVL
ncbi:MAG: hypothetical protein ACREN7_00250 [Candidatus Dormibacteria bacterium]